MKSRDAKHVSFMGITASFTCQGKSAWNSSSWLGIDHAIQFLSCAIKNLKQQLTCVWTAALRKKCGTCSFLGLTWAFRQFWLMIRIFKLGGLWLWSHILLKTKVSSGHPDDHSFGMSGMEETEECLTTGHYSWFWCSTRSKLSCCSVWRPMGGQSFLSFYVSVTSLVLALVCVSIYFCNISYARLSKKVSASKYSLLSAEILDRM